MYNDDEISLSNGYWGSWYKKCVDLTVIKWLIHVFKPIFCFVMAMSKWLYTTVACTHGTYSFILSQKIYSNIWHG